MQDVASSTAGGRVLMVSSLDTSHPAANVLDGNTGSYWISTGLYPQELILGLGQPASVASVRLLSTKVRQLRIEGCPDDVPVQFLPLVEKELTDTDGIVQDEKFTCDAHPSKTMRFLRLVVLSGWHDFCSVHGVQVQPRFVDNRDSEIRARAGAFGSNTPSLFALDNSHQSLLSVGVTLEGSLEFSRSDPGDGGTLLDFQRIDIKVWCASGKSCAVTADESWTIGDVKNDVERKLGIPASEQKLVMGIEPLGDAESLSNIAPEASALDFTVVQCDPKQALWITQVKRDGLLLRFAQDLNADRDIVFAAVLQNGDSLQFASKDLQDNREIVLSAIRQRGSAVQWASDELRSDREVALTAVSQSGMALQNLAEHFRADREVVFQAVQQKGSALRFASRELRCDQEIVDAATANFFFSQEELKQLQEPESPTSTGDD